MVDGVSYAGQVYYIDCLAGNDSADGRSPATAWRTTTQVNTKTQVGYWDTVKANTNTNPPNHAPWTAAPSGSAFLFKRGCTFDGFLNVHAVTYSGSLAIYSENITFGAYGDRFSPRPTIQYVTPSTQYKAVLWSNKHTVHVRNLRLVGNPTVVSAGVWLHSSKGSTFGNSSIESVHGDGINGDYTVDLLVSNSTIARTQLSGGRGGGLVGSGSNLQVLNSTFIDNGKDKLGAHNIYVRHLVGARFLGNSVSGGSNLGLVLHGTSSDVVIRDNDIFGNSNGIDVTGAYSEAEVFENITIERNRIRDNGYRPNEQGYGLLLKSMVNSSIRNNLVYGNRLGAINLADANAGDAYAKNLKIYQNLFLDPSTGSGAVFNGSNLSNIDVRNNILVQMSATKTALNKNATVPEAALILNNNLYYAPNNSTGKLLTYNGGTYTVAEVASMTGKETSGVQADPAFVNAALYDFRAQPTSPARNQGAPLGVLHDFTGMSRSTTSPTLGAYE